MKVKATVENKGGLYSVYSDDHIGKYYFGGFGFSEEEALADFKESIIEAFEANLEIEVLPSQTEQL